MLLLIRPDRKHRDLSTGFPVHRSTVLLARFGNLEPPERGVPRRASAQPEMPTVRVMGSRCPSRVARSRSEQAAILPDHPLPPTGFPLPAVAVPGAAVWASPFLTKLSSFLSPLEKSLCESNTAAGLSGLPHRFLASAAVSSGSSDTDRT
jgi:hypothetical protein